eukprot:scaffold108827_cov46-Prasinocladus_malaysianus.AAC.1
MPFSQLPLCKELDERRGRLLTDEPPVLPFVKPSRESMLMSGVVVKDENEKDPSLCSVSRACLLPEASTSGLMSLSVCG